MKLLLAQPSIPRFKWELEVLLTNLKQYGDLEIILLFNKTTDTDLTVPPFLEQKYGVRSFMYLDGRMTKRYIPSIRPYLLWQFFKAHPEMEGEQFLYIDSDIIFREWPDFATCPFDPSKVYGADVHSYIDLDYILKCDRGPEIAQKMATICGITVDQMRGVPGIGAQLVLNGNTADFWERAYHNSNDIYNMLLPIPESTDPDHKTIQKWTAEMWAQQWGWVREGKTLVIAPELNHSTPTDTIDKYYDRKILHNAGVPEAGPMFFKGGYKDRLPWDEDFSDIDPNLATVFYVEAIQKVVH